MKKALFAVAGILLTGGVLTLSYFDSEQTVDSSEKVVQADSTTETKSETAAATSTLSPLPTERTVDTRGGYPWQYFGAKQIIEGQKNGEVYYLFSDAEAFENTIVEFAVAEELEGAPITKVDNGISFANYLQGFIEGTQKYLPDQQDYFLKLSEIQIDLQNGNFEAIPEKIKEAKVLRAS